jgi:hypothetical protein
MNAEARNEMPNRTGYFWAKWRIASDDTPEGDELTPCDDWEIVQINENGGEGLTEYSVSVPGVAVVQWRDCFVWGSFVAPLKQPTPPAVTKAMVDAACAAFDDGVGDPSNGKRRMEKALRAAFAAT